MKALAKIAAGFIALLVLLAALDYAFPEASARNSFAIQRAISGLELKQTQIPGFDIPYLEGGPAGGEPLVLLHGISADKDNFDRVAMFLTPKMRVISMDVPGFGDSSKPTDADYGIPKQVERLDQFLTTLGIQKAHFGGSSMGGLIVASYAIAHPEKVSSLWLLDPAGVIGGKQSDVRRAYEERGEYLLFAKTQEEFEHIVDIVMSKPPMLPYSVKQVLGRRAIADYDLHTRIFRELFKSAPQIALESRIKGLTIPTLIVWGAEDRATDVSDAEILHGLMPNSSVQILDGVGHLPHLEAEYPVAKAYKDFRAKL